MHHRKIGRSVYWLIALAAAVSVIFVGFRLAQPTSSHLAKSADVTRLGGWGRGGYTMMPGPADAQGPVFANAAAAMSENWAGYAATGQQGSFTSVSASWLQPSVTCAGAESFAAFWVGLDGDGTQTVEQTGVEADCDGATTTYQGWYEIFPAAPVFYDQPVHSRDAMTASVVFDGGGTFTLTLSDATAGWTQTTRANSPDAALGSAEIIAEAPTDQQAVLPLADFGTADFTDATVNHQAFGDEGGLTAITMASNSATLAVPSAFTDDSTFTVTWENTSGASQNGNGNGQGDGNGNGNGDGGYGDGGYGDGGYGNGGYGDGGQGSWGQWWGGY